MSLPKRDGVHDRYYLIHKPDTSPEVLAEADLCIQDVLNGTARENHSAYPTVVRNHNGTPFLPDQLLERYLTGLPLKEFPCDVAVSLCDAMRRLVGWEEIRYTLEKYIEKQVQERRIPRCPDCHQRKLFRLQMHGYILQAVPVLPDKKTGNLPVHDFRTDSCRKIRHVRSSGGVLQAFKYHVRKRHEADDGAMPVIEVGTGVERFPAHLACLHFFRHYSQIVSPSAHRLQTELRAAVFVRNVIEGLRFFPDLGIVLLRYMPFLFYRFLFHDCRQLMMNFIPIPYSVRHTPVLPPHRKRSLTEAVSAMKSARYSSMSSVAAQP